MHSKVPRFPGVFPGTIKAPLDVPSLARNSDLVCVGQVQDIQEEARVQFLVGDEVVTFSRRLARFRVDRVEKGIAPDPSIEIEYLQTDFPSSLERLQPGEHVRLFLKKNHRWRFTDPTTSKCETGFISPEFFQ